MKVPSLKTGQMLTLTYFIGILIVLFIVYKILGAVGIIQTRKKRVKKATEEKAETSLRASAYFDPLFLRDKLEGYTPLKTLAANYAFTLHRALVRPGTDEEAVYTTFGKLRSKYNISEVALYYYQQYKRNLLNDILNDLNDSEQVTLFNIIEKLPTK